MFNYRLSRARRVVESAFGICASKWRILDKAIETKVDTGVEIVKCISLLHNIIIDFEGYFCLHSRWSQHDSLSLTPTRPTRKQRTNKLGCCYQPERPICTLTRYALRRRTAPFTSTYMNFSTQMSRRETRVHACRFACNGPYDNPTISQTSWIVCLRSAWIASRTFAVFSGVMRVHGRPERSWSSTDVRPWSVCTIKKFCFFSWHYLRRLPVAFDGFLQQFSLRLKQNLMQFLCFVKLVISVVKKKFAGSLKHNLTKTHWT